jgi:hypothetical protein
MKRTFRDAILARDRFTCQTCGRHTSGQVYHILRRGQSGYDLPQNLITLCGRCQMLVSSMPLKVLKRLLRISELEIVAEKARVQEAIEVWILSKSQDVTHPNFASSELASSMTASRAPVQTARVKQHPSLSEWKKSRPHAGKSWSSGDDNTLLADFSAGLSLEEIASRLGRGVFAVQVRLCKLGRNVTS